MNLDDSPRENWTCMRSNSPPSLDSSFSSCSTSEMSSWSSSSLIINFCKNSSSSYWSKSSCSSDSSVVLNECDLWLLLKDDVLDIDFGELLPSSTYFSLWILFSRTADD